MSQNERMRIKYYNSEKPRADVFSSCRPLLWKVNTISSSGGVS